MKLKCKIAIAMVAVVLAMTALAGCGGVKVTDTPDLNANVPAGAAPVLPLGHEGRYDRLGADGCYGCHGANDEANPMLKTAVAIPDDHYVNGDHSSKEIDPSRMMCTSCHVQGLAPTTSEK